MVIIKYRPTLKKKNRYIMCAQSVFFLPSGKYQASAFFTEQLLKKNA